MTSTTPPRKKQPQIGFRATEELAKAFRDKCSLEGTPQQIVLETLVRAFADDELPDIRELRRTQLKRQQAD